MNTRHNAGDAPSMSREQSKRKVIIWSFTAGILIVALVVAGLILMQRHNQQVLAEETKAQAVAAAQASKEAEERDKERKEQKRARDAAVARAAAQELQQLVDDAEAQGWTHISGKLFYGENNTECNRTFSCVSLTMMSGDVCPRGVFVTARFTDSASGVILDTVYRNTGPMNAMDQAVLEFLTTSTADLYEIHSAECR